MIEDNFFESIMDTNIKLSKKVLGKIVDGTTSFAELETYST